MWYDLIWNFSRDILGELVAGLVGAFAGAWVAFRLERGKVKTDNFNADRAALIRAQLVLCCQHESLENMRRNYAAFSHIKDGNFPPLSQIFDEATVDIASLSFLVEHDEAGLIMAANRAVKSYRGACGAISDRNSHIAEMRTPLPEEILTLQMGRLKRLTAEIYTSIDHAVRDNIATTEGIRLLAKRLFPGNFPRLGPYVATGTNKKESKDRADEEQQSQPDKIN